MKTTLSILLILIFQTIICQEKLRFESDYFSGTLEYAHPDRASIANLERTIEIELDTEIITISFGEKTDQSIFDMYLEQLSLISKNENFELNDFGKIIINNRIFYWVGFSRADGNGFNEVNVNLAYLSKFKDSFIFINAYNMIPFQESINSYTASLKKIIETIELN